MLQLSDLLLERRLYDIVAVDLLLLERLLASSVLVIILVTAYWCIISIVNHVVVLREIVIVIVVLLIWLREVRWVNTAGLLKTVSALLISAEGRQLLILELLHQILRRQHINLLILFL